jgi:hypothetical protein
MSSITLLSLLSLALMYGPKSYGIQDEAPASGGSANFGNSTGGSPSGPTVPAANGEIPLAQSNENQAQLIQTTTPAVSQAGSNLNNLSQSNGNYDSATRGAINTNSAVATASGLLVDEAWRKNKISDEACVLSGLVRQS